MSIKKGKKMMTIKIQISFLFHFVKALFSIFSKNLSLLLLGFFISTLNGLKCVYN